MPIVQAYRALVRELGIIAAVAVDDLGTRAALEALAQLPAGVVAGLPDTRNVRGMQGYCTTFGFPLPGRRWG